MAEQCKSYVIKAYLRDLYTHEIIKGDNGKPLTPYYEASKTSTEHPQHFTYKLKDAKRFEFISDAKADAKRKSIAKMFHDDPKDYFVVKLVPKKK